MNLINCRKCKTPIDDNDKDAFLPYKEESKSLCGNCNMDFGLCPVCNSQLRLDGIGDEWVQDIMYRHPHIYIHRGCYDWLNTLVIKGECDKCHREDVELVGANSYGRLCMRCTATMTIMPLSEYTRLTAGPGE